MHLEERIDCIKGRPGMYITAKKVENIECFLRGILLAIEYYDKKNEYDEFFDKYFLEWVKEWLYRKKDLTFDEDYGKYSQYIRKVSKDDEESFTLFFEIEKDFREMYNNRNKG